MYSHRSATANAAGKYTAASVLVAQTEMEYGLFIYVKSDTSHLVATLSVAEVSVVLVNQGLAKTLEGESTLRFNMCDLFRGYGNEYNVEKKRSITDREESPAKRHGRPRKSE